MSNSKELLEAYIFGLINFTEYHLLLQGLKYQTMDYRRGQSFSLHAFTDEDCLAEFRFSKLDIIRLTRAFGLDTIFTTQKRERFHGMEGLCIMLKRLSYPCRLRDLSKVFHRGPTSISEIFKWMLQHVDKNFGHLLETFDQDWLSLQNLLQFSNAITAKGSPVQLICGFLDGTVRPVCNPSRNQRQYYSGHKRIHCVKYQAVTCPNGIVARLDGPYIGRRHDSKILNLSKLNRALAKKMKIPGREHFVLFGDAGYANTKYVLSSYRYAPPGTIFKVFNGKMAKVRITIEWGFGKVLALFGFTDFKKNLKVQYNSK